MEFKQIEAFVNVVKYKSFSKAADASFLTQPTISSHVSALEKELGVTLIDRMGRESKPTKQGQAFYKYALDIMHTREKAFMAIQCEKENLRGVLEIQTSTTPGEYLLPEIISKFYGLHPNVRFYVEQSDSRQVLEDIKEQKSEIGFVGSCKDKYLIYDRIASDKSLLVTPKTEEYIKLRDSKKTVKIEDLARESFIWREEGSATREAFEKQYYEKTGHLPKVVATMNNIEAMKRAVACDLGIAILPRLALKNRESEDLLCFEIEDMDFYREFFIIHKKNAALSPLAAEFRRFVLEMYGKQD